jgi:hypothetical protein
MLAYFFFAFSICLISAFCELIKSKWLRYFLSFWILSICAFGFIYFWNQVDTYKAQLEVYQVKEQAINKIQKTLAVAYNLSEPEQKVLAMFYYEGQHAAPKAQGMDWEWLAACHWIESRFDVTACSNKNACNIPQIREETFAEQCRKLKIPYKKNKTIWNDAIALQAGINYLLEGDSLAENRIKRYIGGAGYLNVKKGTDTQLVIEEYYQNVKSEYQKLQYIYKGIDNEQ